MHIYNIYADVYLYIYVFTYLYIFIFTYLHIYTYIVIDTYIVIYGGIYLYMSHKNMSHTDMYLLTVEFVSRRHTYVCICIS